MRWSAFGAALLLAVASGSAAQTAGLPDSDWPAVGGGAGGTRFAPHAQIDRSNVASLEVAWTFRTGDLPVQGSPNGSKFEATPVHAWGMLFVSTPRNRVIALEPETGRELWRYDPEIPADIRYSEGFVSRGVALWESSGGGACSRRVFLGTMDARLIALDAASGRPCSDFGTGGLVDLNTPETRPTDRGQYSLTSPPAVVGEVVVVGSSIGDNRQVELERGIVRGYDARAGALLWLWDPIPAVSGAAGADAWDLEQARRTGGANAWGILSTDPERGLVFVPTGSAAPDFYGGERLGDNRFANSIVALRAATGEVVWHFQVVHHDLWDYDIPAQPVLTTVRIGAQAVPVVIQTTKMGHVFVLHRDTGEPVFPVEERPVPASDVPGEQAWPTQPFPTRPAPLHPHRMDPDSVFGVDAGERAACRAAIEGMRNEGIFTPPALEGSILYPSYIGGSNWGGMAYASDRGIAVVPINRLAVWVKLIPRDRFVAERQSGIRAQFSPQRGTPYGMAREILFSPSGLPCSPPPWGLLHGIDIATGEVRWTTPVGRFRGTESLPGADAWGSALLGGPIVTAGGLVFMAAAMDDRLRALDIETGEVLWTAELPAGGNAIPMSYVGADGRQYVVIAAGGHANLGTTPGDYLVAFALPR